jgi:hypothetical protein
MCDGQYLWQILAASTNHVAGCRSVVSQAQPTGTQELSRLTQQHLAVQQRQRDAKTQAATSFLEAFNL